MAAMQLFHPFGTVSIALLAHTIPLVTFSNYLDEVVEKGCI